ncbi:MAG TPA: PQQ-binding-like beta-propeller repeat protein, partial [Blastocatellia bacterium]|nr:PQQ-binding-like beta-propeller repeat protein [Blastocatellia bacterium]
MRRFTRYSLFIVCLTNALLTIPIAAQNGAKKPAKDRAGKGEWRYYGGDGGSTKYSPLDQINKENAGKLKVAWAWDSPDLPLQKENRMLSSFAHEATPLMIGGRLYTSTSLSQVAAIDAGTGQTIWTFNPEAYKAGRPTNLGFVHRGVAYWTDGARERILIAAHDASLWAIDAKTGKPAGDFGENGRVNLAKAIPLAVPARNYTMTSPPVICRDVVIVGSSISDGPQFKEAPRGDIQAFDVRTGKPLWIFHNVPQADEFGNETWENESWKYTGAANTWTLMSV